MYFLPAGDDTHGLDFIKELQVDLQKSMESLASRQVFYREGHTTLTSRSTSHYQQRPSTSAASLYSTRPKLTNINRSIRYITTSTKTEINHSGKKDGRVFLLLACAMLGYHSPCQTIMGLGE